MTHAYAFVLFAGGLLLAPAGGRAEERPEREKIKLSTEAREKAAVCTDGKSHYVVVTPNDSEKKEYTQVFYGDGKRFILVPQYRFLTRTLFRDPRYYNKRASGPDRWRSSEADMRLVSGVKQDEKSCEAWCGERSVPLTLVGAEKAKSLLQSAKFEPSIRKWVPYALARDDDGNYYYVDHGYWADTAKNYRVFVGTKGGMKEQAVVNVISDSEGDIIKTKGGTLRMPARGDVVFAQGTTTTKLTAIPLTEDREEHAKNILMVWNELGVYKGERLGTPCDDL